MIWLAKAHITQYFDYALANAYAFVLIREIRRLFGEGLKTLTRIRSAIIG